MIKINELRAGDYYKKGESIIKTKTPKGFNKKEIEPIKITVDLLIQNLDCVSLDGNLYLDYYNGAYSGCFRFKIYGEKVYIEFFNSTIYWDLHRIKGSLEHHQLETAIRLDFEYLHQLQNFYSSLTGKELVVSF